MGILVWCPEAPRLQGFYPCRMSPCTPEVRCGYCEDGVEELDEAEDPSAETTFTNAQFQVILDLIQERGLEGALVPSEIPRILQRILVALNRDLSREPHLVPPVDRDERATRGAWELSFGVTHEDIQEHLTAFRGVLLYAHRNNFEVLWG